MLKEGEMIMEEMIEDCKKLAGQNLSDSALAEAVTNLKNEALNRNNPYIRALLCKA